MKERLEWLRKTQEQLAEAQKLAEDRTNWALTIDRDYQALVAAFHHQKAEMEALAEAERVQWEARKWIRLGRKLGAL
jgi:hypothetical protein